MQQIRFKKSLIGALGFVCAFVWSLAVWTGERIVLLAARLAKRWLIVCFTSERSCISILDR